MSCNRHCIIFIVYVYIQFFHLSMQGFLLYRNDYEDKQVMPFITFSPSVVSKGVFMNAVGHGMITIVRFVSMMSVQISLKHIDIASHNKVSNKLLLDVRNWMILTVHNLLLNAYRIVV